jgi:hypothetical protein
MALTMVQRYQCCFCGFAIEPRDLLHVEGEMEKALTELIGKRMWTCRRAADIATFQFGQRKHAMDYYDRSTEVGEYALHVQCAWRIVSADTVTVGSRDLYYPAQYVESESIPEDFDWDRDPNRRDSLVHKLFENGKKEFMVRRVEVGAAAHAASSLTRTKS